MSNTKIKAAQFHGVVGHGTDGYFLMTNADGSMSWSQASTGPSVTSVAYPGDDTAADPAGGQTVVLIGTGFAASGMTVTIGGTTASSVAHDSNTQLTITTPAKAAGDYDIVVTNTVTGASGTFVNGISYNGVPAWTTAAGSLGTFESETTISTITLAATEPDGGTITFNITNGALPTGLSLTGANIDGTTTAESSTTLYSFTIEAIDDENQATPRNFSITVNSAAIVSSENFTINTYTGNGSTQAIEGKIGTAASFNGSSSYIDTNISTITSNVGSVSLWVKTTTGTQSAFFGGQSPSQNRFYFGVRNNNFWMGAGDSQNSYNISASSLLDGNWHHVALTLDGSTAKYYLDGNSTPVDTLSYTSAGTIGVTPLIGALDAVGTVSSYTNGSIDQVRIFNKALSSSEVTTLYGENNASSTKSTRDIFADESGVALYEFEKGAIDTGANADTVDTADIFEDNSIIDFYQFNGNTQSTNNAPFYSLQTTSTTYGDGILGQSLYLNGSQTASLTANTYGTMNLTGSYSLSLYFNATTASKRNIIWYLEQINGYTSVIEFGSDNKLYFGGATITSQTYSANTWYNIVISFDASNGLIKAYVDGQLLGSRTGNTTTGSIQCFGHGGVGLTGYIDQARFFNRVITDSEAAELYEARVKYDGTPTNVNFVGTSFQPDLVWIKNRSITPDHILFDSIRGAEYYIRPNTIDNQNASADATTLNSFDSNGFTISGATNTGSNGHNFVAWCWKAGGNSNTYNVDDTGYSTASAAGLSSANATTLNGASVNTEAGFSIINYETNVNGDNRPAHGLTQEPELIIFKPYDTSVLGWYVMTKKIDGSLDFLFLNTSDAKVDTGTNEFINSTHFRSSFGTTWGSVSAYCFHSVAGYQKVGSYSGTGTTGNKQTIGFRPRFLLSKRTSSASSWYIIDSIRNTTNPRNNWLNADTAGAEYSPTHGVNFEDDGFSFISTDLNGTGQTWIYLAIA